MKIRRAGYAFITHIDPKVVMSTLERCGRVCYKSEGKIAEGSAEKFLANIVSRGHEAVLEHFSFTVKFIVDRGVSHEIVRHRLASYCQESTRYCNYSKGSFGKEITVIDPSYLESGSPEWVRWAELCIAAERAYFELLDRGHTPQEARSVLPTSLKTEVVMTANIREWRHFLRLRTSKAAHPQIREVAIPLLLNLKGILPVLFGDIEVDEEGNEIRADEDVPMKVRCPHCGIYIDADMFEDGWAMCPVCERDVECNAAD